LKTVTWRAIAPAGDEIRQLVRAGDQASLRRIREAHIDRTWALMTQGMKKEVLRLYRATDPANFQPWESAFLKLERAKPPLVIWGGKDPYISSRFAKRFNAQKVVHLAQNRPLGAGRSGGGMRRRLRPREATTWSPNVRQPQPWQRSLRSPSPQRTGYLPGQARQRRKARARRALRRLAAQLDRRGRLFIASPPMS
jgi:hypothetical protein